MKNISNFKKYFDPLILRYLSKKEKELAKVDSESTILLRAICELVENGGRRVRPALYFFANKSYGGDENEAYTRSMVFELFQTFCLIHDDLIDSSDLRRGKPTVHKKYNLSTAILSGDLSLMLADEIFYSFKNSRKIEKIYNQFKQEVLLGQYMDTIKSKNIQKVMDLKTARYSFVRPVEIGLETAGVETKTINKWKEIMQSIGQTFQMKDDLIGIFGREEMTGKSIDSDLLEGKYTLLISLFEKLASTAGKKDFFAKFGSSKLTRKDCNLLRKMLSEKQVPQKIKSEILQNIEIVKKELDCLDKVILHELVFEILDFIGDMSNVSDLSY